MNDNLHREKIYAEIEFLKQEIRDLRNSGASPEELEPFYNDIEILQNLLYGA